ncbi:MAG: hypothetical protein II039_00780, partial [Treponema sp.]|nr:hypothetical protein [Treponema sp.]
SWIITIDPATLDISNIELVDEYDQAKEWFAKKYGTKKQLVRAQIVPFEDNTKRKSSRLDRTCHYRTVGELAEPRLVSLSNHDPNVSLSD